MMPSQERAITMLVDVLFWVGFAGLCFLAGWYGYGWFELLKGISR